MSLLKVSWVIASEHPEKLAMFYSFVIDGEINPRLSNASYCLVQRGNIQIQIYLPSKNRQLLPKGGSTAVCFQKPPSANPLLTLSRWGALLLDQGASFVEAPLAQSFGAEAWLSDPDGNLFIAFVPLKS